MEKQNWKTNGDRSDVMSACRAWFIQRKTHLNLAKKQRSCASTSPSSPFPQHRDHVTKKLCKRPSVSVQHCGRKAIANCNSQVFEQQWALVFAALTYQHTTARRCCHAEYWDSCFKDEVEKSSLLWQIIFHKKNFDARKKFRVRALKQTLPQVYSVF